MARKVKAKKIAKRAATKRRPVTKGGRKPPTAPPRIETPRLGREWKRNPLQGTRRGFAIDGHYAYLRRRTANPAIIERTDAKAKSGEYRHVLTSGDVEVYEIAEDSPLRRKKLSLTEMSLKQIERAIVKAACDEDWRLYYDACSEYAHRHKTSDLPLATSQRMFQDSMRYLELRIMRRGGPTPMRIQAELAGIRKERTGTRLFLPH